MATSSYITGLTCIHCGATYASTNLATASGTWMTCPTCGPADGVLDVGYDLDKVKAAWNERPLNKRAQNHWRYEELLPLEPGAVRHEWSVGYTPIIDSERLARQ